MDLVIVLPEHLPKTKKELKNQSNGRFKIYLSKRIR